MGAASSGAWAAQPASEALARLPEQVVGFRRNGPVAADPTPGVLDGAIQRFGAARAEATVYLFARTPDAVPDGPDSNAVREEYTGSMGSALARLALGKGSGTIKLEREATVKVESGPAVRCGLVRQAVDSGGLQTDFVCVTGALGRLMKLRISARHREEETPAMMSAVARFIGTVARSVVGAPPKSRPPATTEA